MCQLIRLMDMTMFPGSMRSEVPAQFGITDAELWDLVGTSTAHFPHRPHDGRCVLCAEVWPCATDRLASLTDMANRLAR